MDEQDQWTRQWPKVGWAYALGACLTLGVGLAVAGWYRLAAAQYLWGWWLSAAAVTLMAWSVLRGWRSRVRFVVIGLVIAALVAGVLVVGIGVPKRSLATEFAGSGVRWSRTVTEPGDRLATPLLRFGDSVVVGGEDRTFLINLHDGSTAAEILVGNSPTFTLAGDRLIIETAGQFQSYDGKGRTVWPKPIMAGWVLGRAGKVTAFESCGPTMCAATGYNDSGRKVWSHPSGPRASHIARFQQAYDLPLQSSLKSSPVVGTSFAVARKEVGESRDFVWDVMEADTGRTRKVSAIGRWAGVLGAKAVTVQRTREGRCQIAATDLEDQGTAPREEEIPCMDRQPVALEQRLFFRDSSDKGPFTEPNGPPGVHTARPAVKLTWSEEDLAVADGAEDGSAYPDPEGIQGADWNGDLWTFVPGAPGSVEVNEGSVVVESQAKRSNPLDRSVGYQPGREPRDDVDHRTAVLTLDEGILLGQIRTRESPSVLPVGSGSAVLIVDGAIMLLGDELS